MNSFADFQVAQLQPSVEAYGFAEPEVLQKDHT